MKVNGSLVFDASSASEIQNLRVQKVTENPTHTAADVGRLIYNTTDNILYQGGASAWVAVATGGDAAAVQSEVNSLETALGAGINANGTFNAGGFTDVSGVLVDPTSFTDAIEQLASAVNSNNELSELDDVTLTSITDNDLLQYDSGTSEWVNVAIGSASGVQAHNNRLDALVALNTNAILVKTGTATYAGRTLIAPAAGITITDPTGQAGNPTFALANDLAALEGLATTGYVIRTGDGTATTRSIDGTSGRIVVTNGDGVSSNTNVDLDTVTNPGNGGTFVKITTDAYGRVSNSTAVVTADITALVDATYVNVTGDTMSGNLVMSSGATVTGLPAPTADTEAANKAYVDALTNGLSWKQAVRVATTANAPGFVAGVITIPNNNATYFPTTGEPAVVDGVELVVGDRVLVKDQSTAAQNGIYVVTDAGVEGATDAVLTRAEDMNAAVEFDGAAVFVKEGTANESSGWTQTATVTTVNTSTVTFSQFTGGAVYTWGVGLANTGNTINVNVGAGIAELPSDEVGIDLFDSAAGAIILTSSGTDRVTTGASKLHLLLDAAGALAQTSSGLKINAASVTNAMLVNSTFTLNGDSGTDSAALGTTLLFAGSSTQGIATAVTDQTVTISGIDAGATQKGVASFNSGHFSVSSGAVSLDASLDDLNNVSSSDAAATDSILTKTAGDWQPATRAAVVGSTSVGDHNDVTLTSPADGEVLVMNGSGQFVNQKVYHLHTQGSTATTWSVTHNLGVMYCNVTVVDASDEVIIPQSITFDSTTALTVTFNTAIAGKVVVMGIA